MNYLLMPRYQFAGDHHHIECPTSNPADIINALRQGSWFFGSQSNQEFMEGLAERIKGYADVEIPTQSPEQFIDGLIINGFLTRID